MSWAPGFVTPVAAKTRPAAGSSLMILACLLALLCMTGCADKTKVPYGIIPQDKMEKILWDMIEADQYSNLYLIKDSFHVTKDSVRVPKDSIHGTKDSFRVKKDSVRVDVKLETLKLYQQIFQLHQVSREDFEKSFQYYIGRPDLTRRLFDSAIALGNRERASTLSALGAKKPPPQVPAAQSFSPAVTRPGGKIPLLPPGHQPLRPPVLYPSGLPGQKRPGSPAPGPSHALPGSPAHRTKDSAVRKPPI